MSDFALDPALQRIVERVDSVRRRLVIANLLRWGAMTLAVAIIMVAGYAWLDHHLHFGPALRLTALVILVGVGIAGLVLFLRDVRRHIALEHAAGFIEERGRYQQQLLATVEYYNQREDYPYSKDLAQYMVGHVSRQTESADWNTLVPQWPQRLCAAIILVGVVSVFWMALSNGAYFSRYLARLVQPTAAIAPMPATMLELTTEDLVVAEKSSFEIAAEIHGAVPEAGMAILTVDKDGEETALEDRRVDLRPLAEDGAAPRFALLTELPIGDYTYHFEADDARTEAKSIRVRSLPALAALSARVTPPDGLGIETYEEQVENGILTVIEGSEVNLTLNATTPLKSGTATSDKDEALALASAEGTALTLSFNAADAQAISFSFTSEDGLTNDNIPPLAVVLSKDQDPEFEYVSPGSDYLATNVASIPLEMLVKDDFGLTGAELVVEIDGRTPQRFPAEIAKDGKSARIQHTLELETLGLDVGDTILVHAEATDIASGLKTETSGTQSDVNFIEIRAYNQLHHQATPGMPGGANAPQGLGGGDRLPTLLQVLEYSRAIMKKTWSLHGETPLDDEGKRKSASTATDAIFIASKLGALKSRLGPKLTSEQSLDMETARDSLQETGEALESLAVDRAVPPAKTAYRLMRKLVDELEKGEILPGSGGSKDLMEKIKLEEQVHLTRFEDEQVQWELKKLAEELDRLREKQKELGRRFERFLMAQSQQEGHRQSITDEESKAQAQLYPGSASPPDPSEGGGGGSSRVSKDGALLPAKTQSSGSGSGQQPPPPEELLEMLEAAQSDLEEKVAGLEAELGAMSATSSTSTGGDPSSGGGEGESDQNRANRNAAKRASERLADAREHMEELKEAAREAYFQTAKPEDAQRQAKDILESIDDALAESSALVEGVINRNSRERASTMLAAQAKTAAEIAEALEQATDPITEQRLQSELMELTATGHSGGSSYVEHFGGAGAPPLYVSLVDSIVPPADKSNIAAFIDSEPRRAARYLAEQFWSLAIQANRESGALRESETSDAVFNLPERSFFEAAAHYNGEDGS